MKKQNFMRGAAVLAIAGAVSKTLGALYRIPLARMIGDQGMGLYQLAYPIYTTILSLATAGIPVAISVVIARREAENCRGDIKRIFRISFVLLFLFGLFLSTLMIAGGHFIAEFFLHNEQAYWPIVAVAPAIFISSIMSVFRGYFQGQQMMTPTAVSQVIEQLFRVTSILAMAVCLLPYGLEYAAAGATGGAVVGTSIGLLVMIIYFLHYKKTQGKPVQPPAVSQLTNYEIGKELLKLAIPVSLGAIVLPLVQCLDAMIVPSRLTAIGYSLDRATGLYGQLSGMAAVLISLPSIFTIAISTSLVPAISEAFANEKMHAVHERLNYGLRAAMIISIPAAAGMFALAVPICDLLYGQPEAGLCLAPLAFSAMTLAAFQLSSTGLQGIGQPQIVMHHLIVIGICKIILNYTLTSIPALNIQGAAIGTVCAFFIGAMLNLIALRRYTKVKFEIRRFFKICVIAAIMGISARMAYGFMVLENISSYLSTVGGILCGVLVYGILMILFKELDREMVQRILGKKREENA